MRPGCLRGDDDWPNPVMSATCRQSGRLAALLVIALVGIAGCGGSGSSVVCWRFVHLHGFLNATVAQIHVGFNGRAGRLLQLLSSGPRLRHRGCIQTSPAAVTAIERDPSNYYVDVHSQLYPAGAVRGQL